MKIEIDMGLLVAPGGVPQPAMLDLEELLATRLLVQGNSGSGKSHLLRRLLEQSATHVQQVVIDPEGDFASLGARYGHVVIEGERSTAELECIALRVRQHRVSAVLGLDSLDVELQMRVAAVFLNALFEADRDHWYPMLVVVDEAQVFAPAVSGDIPEETRRISLGAMTNLMCRGRKRGLAGIIATQRLAKLAKNVAAEASNFLMGRTFLDIDMARAADLLGLERRQAEIFRELRQGHFVALGPALSRRPVTVKVGPVETRPAASTPTLTPLPEPRGNEARDLILAPVPVDPGRPAAGRRPTGPAPLSMNQILEQIVRDRPTAAMAAEGDSAVSIEERDGVFRTIVHAMMADPEAPFRPEPVLYQDFQTRCRMQKLGGAPLPLADFKLQLAIGRAGVDPSRVDKSEWDRAVRIAKTIPEDLQAVYLIFAGAALQGVPCPSDMAVAHRCGMHSAGRARSRIGHLDKRDLVLTRTDGAGQRIASLPDLGWETAAGDPSAPATTVPIADDRVEAR